MRVHCTSLEMLEFVYNHAKLNMSTLLEEMVEKYGKDLVLSTTNSSYCGISHAMQYDLSISTIDDYCLAHNIDNPFKNNEQLIQIL